MVTDCETRNEIPKPYELISSDDRLSIRFEIREKEREREREREIAIYQSHFTSIHSLLALLEKKKKKENVSTLRARKRTKRTRDTRLRELYNPDVSSGYPIGGVRHHVSLALKLGFKVSLFFRPLDHFEGDTDCNPVLEAKKERKKKKKKKKKFFKFI